MVDRDGRADVDQRIGGNTEFNDLALRLDTRRREMPAHRLADILDLGLADTELQRRISVALFGPRADHLAVVDLEHGDRYVSTVCGEHAGHAHFLCDKTGTHRSAPTA